FIQVSRMANPLVNELVITTPFKDEWNASKPEDEAQSQAFYQNPVVATELNLLDDSRKLAELARKSGVDVTLEVVPEMQHVFQFLAGTAPEADSAIRRLADWVRPKLELG